MSKATHTPHPVDWAVDSALLDSLRRSTASSEDRATVVDMLVALKQIESCLRPDDDDVAARAVRAAIAKAEGGQS